MINGLLVSDMNNEIKGKKRKLNKSNKISDHLVKDYFSTVGKFQEITENLASLTLKDDVSIFHDIKTSIGLVMNSVQNIIGDTPGVNFDDKIDHLEDQNLKDLFFSASLLNDQLQMVDIIINPQRINYGRQKRTAIYRLFHKIVRLFKGRAANRGIDIHFAGSSFAEVQAFESIQFLPLILLDNAVKYTVDNKTIYIDINDNSITNAVDVKVKSYGPIVEEDKWEKIFYKYERAQNTEYFSSQGNGIGLFIAQEIAKAHNFIIVYYGETREYIDGYKIGKNEFSFSIPIT